MSEIEKTLEEMTMPQLWQEAKRRGVSAKGKREELIARLQSSNSTEEGGETMPTAKPKTTEKKETQSKKTEQAVYISKYLELRLVMLPAYTKEVAGRIMPVNGTSIQFHEGVYRTSDPEEIEFLDGHPNNGNAFTKVEKRELDTPTSKLIAKKYQDLEQREAEIKAKEEELKRREMALTGQQEGAKQETVTGIRSTADQPKF